MSPGMKKASRDTDLQIAAPLLAVVLLSGSFARPEAAPQQDAVPRFRAESELVLVDLVATDGKIQFFRLEQVEVADPRPGEPSPLLNFSGRPSGPGVLLLDSGRCRAVRGRTSPYRPIGHLITRPCRTQTP